MFRILYSDMRKLAHDRGFLATLSVNVFYPLVITLFLMAISQIFYHERLFADQVCFQFQSIAIFLVTAGTLLFTMSEYADGCIRNKIISGAKRSDIFLSAAVMGGFQGVLHSFTGCLTALLIRLLLTGEYQTYTIPEVADYWLITTMACASIGVFTTMLIMIFGGKKASYILGLFIATFMKIMSLSVLDKLYPEKGHCRLTGAKLAVYNFIDRFVPYTQLSFRPHRPFTDYMAGSAGLIILSLVIGLILFNRKELQ
ncbi:MAG: hypothetical protein K5739_05240 [Lachnospiraceae bacterium]|nr:hypothetical protein [Lachnospiraceae bacterium]